ncbi:MAG: ATP-binding protein, partial [Firmicutes bacterium]|nr:ATP-binding protein [Bacillota bacterium]
SSGEAEIRDIVVNSLHSGNATITDQTINQCVSVQKDFRDFSEMYTPGMAPSFHDQLLTSYSFRVGEFQVVFNCFNTSWISELHERPGTMLFPIERYKKVLEETRGDLVISVLHHPLNWFRPDNARVIRRLLENTSDVILSGHEHVADYAKKMDLDMRAVEYLEGGVLNEHGDATTREFNLIQYRLDEHLHNISKYHFEGGSFVELRSTDWVSLDKIRNGNQDDFRICDEFESYLSDPGAALTHPRKTQLVLEDTFVFPDAKIISIDDKSNESIEYVSLRVLEDIDEHDNKSFVFGDEDSGKTTLCKVLFKSYYNRGYIPVIVNGEAIRSHGIDDFQKLILRCYEEQYSAGSLERFRQLENEKKVVIVDSLDRSRLNQRFKYHFITNIAEVYKNILITANEVFELTDFIGRGDVNDSENPLLRFRRFEMVPLGHRLRFELVNQWNKLGRIETIEDTELLEENDRLVDEINTVIGDNFVPPWPIIVLILLQTMESGLPHNLQESSYGYYYDLLITKSLLDLKLKPNQVDTLHNYITELAFLFYTRKLSELSDAELREFHESYQSAYDISSYDIIHSYSTVID